MTQNLTQYWCIDCDTGHYGEYTKDADFFPCTDFPVLKCDFCKKTEEVKSPDFLEKFEEMRDRNLLIKVFFSWSGVEENFAQFSALSWGKYWVISYNDECGNGYSDFAMETAKSENKIIEVLKKKAEGHLSNEGLRKKKIWVEVENR